ncbi:MAG: DM13 domain-containing protein [Microcoleaceae cyanobacterium]
MILKNIKTVSLASALMLATLGSFSLPLKPISAQPSSQQLAQNIIASGSFVTVDQDHPTEGTAQIITENGKRYLEFSQEFTTARGPAVEIIMYRNSSVPVNVAEADYVTLAPLESFDGAQRYEIPANINPSDFKAVAIWCRQFNVTFGYAAL